MTRSRWAEARELSFAAGERLPSESIPIAAAVGRVLATDVLALGDLPHYASSAMDGWAVSGPGPWRIRQPPVPVPVPVPVSGPLTGQATGLAPGEATAIITGGVIPAGTLGILRSENAIVADGVLVSTEPTEPHRDQHIRPAGEEAIGGDVVVRAGALLNPAHIALAAICGHDRLEVVALPRVGFLFTGDEVVEAGMPLPGQVRDSFGPQLPAFASALGGSVASRQRVGDDFDATIAAIVSADCDILISTGGTGSSSADHLRDALETLGAEFVVDGVAMRPGGPTLLARLPGGRLVVCLPGNPLAAMIGMLTIAQPLLAAVGGRARPTTASVVAAEDVAGRASTTLLIPYRLVDANAVPNQWRSAGMMRGLADAAGVLVVPEDGIRAGEVADSLVLPWHTR